MKITNKKKTTICVIVLCMLIIAVGFYFNHPHSYKETLISEASCNEEGTLHHICWCGEEYNEHPKPLGHDYVSEVTQDATCTEKGIITYICSRCSDTYSEEIEPIGHDYVQEEIEKAGYIREVCTRCKEVVERKDEEFWKNIITMYVLENSDIYIEASTDSAVLGSLKKGDSVTVSKVGEWDELVMDDGTVGYVRGDLLSDTNPSESAPVDTKTETTTSTNNEPPASTPTTQEEYANRFAKWAEENGATTGGDPTGVTGVATYDRETSVDISGVTLH